MLERIKAAPAKPELLAGSLSSGGQTAVRAHEPPVLRQITRELRWNTLREGRVLKRNPSTEAHAAGVLGTSAEGCETPERAA